MNFYLVLYIVLFITLAPQIHLSASAQLVPDMTGFFAPDWFKEIEKARSAAERGDFTLAEDFLKNRLTKAEKDGQNPKYGTPYLGFPTSLSGELASLAECYLHYGKFDRAESLFKQAIALAPGERLYEGGLADLYAKQKKYGEAEAILKQAMTMAKDKQYRYYQDKLIDLYMQQTKYEQATALIKEGSNHPEKAVKLHDYDMPDQLSDRNLLCLAKCFDEQDKYSDAEALYLRSIKNLEDGKNLPGNHSSLQDQINKLPLGLQQRYILIGDFFLKHKKFTQAKNYFEHARSIKQDSLNPVCSRESFYALSHLADVAAAENNLTKAKSLYKEALSGYSTLPFRLPSEEEVTTRQHYAELLKRLNQLSEAKIMEARAIDSQQEITKSQQHYEKWKENHVRLKYWN